MLAKYKTHGFGNAGVPQRERRVATLEVPQASQMR